MEDMKILNMSAPDFIEQLRDALGIAPGDTISITTPQFDRVDDLEVPIPAESIEKMRLASFDTLKAVGCSPWNEPDDNGDVLMLFPYQWYAHIPAGMTLHGIGGSDLIFEPGKTDDDRRFGVLVYGVKVKRH